MEKGLPNWVWYLGLGGLAYWFISKRGAADALAKAKIAPSLLHEGGKAVGNKTYTLLRPTLSTVATSKVAVPTKQGATQAQNESGDTRLSIDFINSAATDLGEHIASRTTFSSPVPTACNYVATHAQLGGSKWIEVQVYPDLRSVGTDGSCTREGGQVANVVCFASDQPTLAALVTSVTNNYATITGQPLSKAESALYTLGVDWASAPDVPTALDMMASDFAFIAGKEAVASGPYANFKVTTDVQMYGPNTSEHFPFGYATVNLGNNSYIQISMFTTHADAAAFYANDITAPGGAYMKKSAKQAIAAQVGCLVVTVTDYSILNAVSSALLAGYQNVTMVDNSQDLTATLKNYGIGS